MQFEAAAKMLTFALILIGKIESPSTPFSSGPDNCRSCGGISVSAPLRIQTIAQSGKRAAVARVSVEIGSKNLVGFGQLLRLQQNATEHRPNWRIPRRRFAVIKSVFGSDGLRQRIDRAFVVVAAARDHSGQD